MSTTIWAEKRTSKNKRLITKGVEGSFCFISWPCGGAEEGLKRWTINRKITANGVSRIPDLRVRHVGCTRLRTSLSVIKQLAFSNDIPKSISCYPRNKNLSRSDNPISSFFFLNYFQNSIERDPSGSESIRLRALHSLSKFGRFMFLRLQNRQNHRKMF